MKYLNWKDLKPCVADLKKVYQANNESMGLAALQAAEEKWGKKYPVIFKSWKNNWERLTVFFEYSPALRKLFTLQILLKATIEWFERSLKLKELSILKGPYLNKYIWPQ